MGAKIVYYQTNPNQTKTIFGQIIHQAKRCEENVLKKTTKKNKEVKK
jgi:hypothetical protein